MSRTTLAVCSLVLLLAAPAVQAEALRKSVPFKLGSWITLDHVDGPVTLHRVRMVEQSGPIRKADLLRPSGSAYLRSVQLQLEYSNSGSKDWEARIEVEWLDGSGEVIDGYRGDEELDNGESHDVATVTLATLAYGISRARTLRLSFDVHPE